MIIYNISRNFNKLDESNFKITFTDDKNIYISESLYYYLNNAKNDIEVNLEKWEFFKKITNPYEFVHSHVFEERYSKILKFHS